MIARLHGFRQNARASEQALESLITGVPHFADLRKVHVQRVDFLGTGIALKHHRVVWSGGAPWSKYPAVYVEVVRREKHFGSGIAKLDASELAVIPLPAS